jgi:uncharacterized SAM-binding protein YcdF (DUF218 family)
MNSAIRSLNLTNRAIGADGYFTLLLSNAVLVLTFGLYWLWLTKFVYRTAKDTATEAADNDVIAVLGVKLIDDRMSEEYCHRINRAIELFEQGIANKILLVGGRTGANSKTEAACAMDYLLKKGLAREHILLEDRSRHTLENLRNARDGHLGRNHKSAAIVTSRYHLARSHVFAKQLQLTHVVCAAEEAFELSPKTVGKLLLEGYFLHWYMVGKLWARSVNNQKSLSRIQ